MLAKLLSVLAHAKGAAAATVLVVGAAGATVAASNPDVQTTVTNVTTSISTTLSSVSTTARCDDGQGQPAVVAQRNSAEKFLRDAWGVDHKALVDLRGGKDVDNKAVGDIVQNYDGQLKDRLDKALNDVAALTLGRDGQVRKAESSDKPSGSPDASRSPKPSESPKPSCSAKPTPTLAAATTPSESPKASGSGKPADDGRLTVAERTTLNADVQAIVTSAIKDMDDLVRKAMDEASKLPAPDRGSPNGGKPSENPGNKPSGSPRG